MKQKYVLTDETRIIGNGRVVHRIRATRDIILDGEKIVSDGELGGWVECTDNLSHGGEAWVFGNAMVFGNARVFDAALVSDDALVSGKARVFGNAQVSGDALVCGNARVYGNAHVSGYTKVSGNE